MNANNAIFENPRLLSLREGGFRNGGKDKKEKYNNEKSMG